MGSAEIMGNITIRNRKPPQFWHVDGRVMEAPADVLGSEAKVLYGYLSSRPGTWVYNRQAAINLVGSSYKLDKAVKQLKEMGLLLVERDRQNGLFTGCVWDVLLYEDSKLQGLKTPTKSACHPFPDYPEHDIPEHDNQDALEENIPIIEQVLEENSNNRPAKKPVMSEPIPEYLQGVNFWKAYKRNKGKGSKKAFLKLWKKLSLEQKQKAWDYYQQRCQHDDQWSAGGDGVPWPENYIKRADRYWDGDPVDWQAQHKQLNLFSSNGSAADASPEAQNAAHKAFNEAGGHKNPRSYDAARQAANWAHVEAEQHGPDFELSPEASFLDYWNARHGEGEAV